MEMSPHHLARKVRHLAVLHDCGLERVAVLALGVVRLGSAAFDFMRFVAEHAAHARAHMLHDALRIGAVVHVLHVVEQAPEVLLALAQLGLDLALVRHVHAAHEHGGRTVPFNGHAADQHHAQVAPLGADAELGRLVGPPGLLGHGHLLDAVGGAHLVEGVHKVARQSPDQAVDAGRLQQLHAGGVGKADGTLLCNKHSRWQQLQQAQVVVHGLVGNQK